MDRIANRLAFDRPESRARAMGVDFSAAQAIVDARGTVLAYARTGGMLDPQRAELKPGVSIYRFGGGGRSADRIAQGAWWLEQRQFERLVSFANVHQMHVGLALRLLCLVPPEWSDLDMLVRARTRVGLLAWRGLAATVITPAGDGGPDVRLPHRNDIAEHRLHQIYVPGLTAWTGHRSPIAVEQVHRLERWTSLQGFLYL